jgi:hypothetical protein
MPPSVDKACIPATAAHTHLIDGSGQENTYKKHKNAGARMAGHAAN